MREILSVDADGHYAITTSRAELRATAEHPFFVGDGTYKTVEALAEGDTVYAFDGQRLSPQKIRKITRVPGKVRVFNLRTDPPNTFFAAGVAVHNKGGGGEGAGGAAARGPPEVPGDRAVPRRAVVGASSFSSFSPRSP